MATEEERIGLEQRVYSKTASNLIQEAVFFFLTFKTAIMKKNLLLFLIISTLICLSSCASLNGYSSKKELEETVHAKIDSRKYRIDIMPEVFTGEDGTNLYIPGYIQVCGDSVISCMTYDNPFPGSFPPKNYVENMQGVKYEILDYQQTETRRGRRIVSFWFKIDYEEYDPYTLAKFKDRLVPVRYRLEFGNSTRVRVLQSEYLMFGTLSL